MRGTFLRGEMHLKSDIIIALNLLHTRKGLKVIEKFKHFGKLRMWAMMQLLKMVSFL